MIFIKKQLCPKCHRSLSPKSKYNFWEEAYKVLVTIVVLMFGMMLVFFQLPDWFVAVAVAVLMILSYWFAVKYLIIYTCQPCNIDYELKDKKLRILQNN